jgi:hypothetical protein
MQHTGVDDCGRTPWHALFDEMCSEDPRLEVVQDLLEAEYRFLVELALEPYNGSLVVK